MHFCVSLSLFLCLSLLNLPSSFMMFFLLSLATGLLAVFHHLTEHQVALSGRLYIANHSRHGDDSHISVSEHEYSRVSPGWQQKCDTAQTKTRQPEYTRKSLPRLFLATAPGSWLLKEMVEGKGNPQLCTGSHSILMTLTEWRVPHCTTSTPDAKNTPRPAKCKRLLWPTWVL